MSLIIGQQAPLFNLPASDGTNLALTSLLGKKVVLFFYPRNMTPSCTQEACDIRDRYVQLADLNTAVVGISTDTVKSHQNFITKKELPYLLLADEQHEVSELYGVWQLKKMYGKEFMGIVRSTFLIDEYGKIAKIWSKVKVKGHADDIVAAVQGL